MGKITIKKIILSIFIIGGFSVYSFFHSDYYVNVDACHGYEKVAEFEKKISSKDIAKEIALNYYLSIGYNFELNDLTVRKIKKYWLITPDRSKIDRQKLCLYSPNSPECIGQELKLEENFFGKNKILMEYQNPC